MRRNKVESEAVATTDYDIKEWVIPHAVLIEPQASWNARVVRARNHRADYGKTSIFQLDDKNYVVGEEANRGTVGRRTGAEKLRKGWLDVLMLAMLLKLYPDGHDNLVIGCAHTTDAVSYVDSIASAIGGKHQIMTPDGRKLTYVVRAMIPFDEPAGGLLRFMTRKNAEYNYEDIAVGHHVLVVDIGGKISSMIPAEVLPGHKVQPFWSRGRTFTLGIQDIIATFEQELRSIYPDQFRMKNIPKRFMHEALKRRGIGTLFNTETDVTQAVLNSTASLIDRVRGVYEDDMEGGSEFNHVIVTGGGGGLLFDTIVDEISYRLRNYTYMADHQDTINLANLRGGEYALSLWASQNGNRINQGKATMPLTYVSLDAGNSDLKAKEVGVGYNVTQSH